MRNQRYVSVITLETQQGLPSKQVAVPGPGDLPQTHGVTWDINSPFLNVSFPYVKW